MTMTKADGTRLTSQAAVRAGTGSPNSDRTSTNRAPVARKPQTLAMSTVAASTGRKVTWCRALAATGRSGKNRSPSGPTAWYPWAARLAYHPASHPTRPSCAVARARGSWMAKWEISNLAMASAARTMALPANQGSHDADAASPRAFQSPPGVRSVAVCVSKVSCAPCDPDRAAHAAVPPAVGPATLPRRPFRPGTTDNLTAGWDLR